MMIQLPTEDESNQIINKCNGCQQKNNASQLEIQFPASKGFSIVLLITLSLIYAKLTVYFYVKWPIIFSPLIIYFCVQQIIGLWESYQILKDKSDDIVTLFNKIKLMWSLTKFMISGYFSGIIWYSGYLIEKYIEISDSHSDEQVNYDISVAKNNIFIALTFSILTYLFYSIIVGYLTLENKLEQQELRPTDIISNLLISTLGNSFTICSGGACNSFYISTFSAFFSAFGITITKYIHYLNFLCILLLGSSLLTLYSVKKTWKYGPFITTFIGAALIFTHLFIYDYYLFTYIGNILIIASAFWNSKLNKFKFGQSSKSV